MSTRETLHDLVEELPMEALHQAECYLRDLAATKPMYTIEDAPYDDEPVTEEDLARWREIRENPQGPFLTTEEVARIFGFNAKA